MRWPEMLSEMLFMSWKSRQGGEKIKEVVQEMAHSS